MRRATLVFSMLLGLAGPAFSAASAPDPMGVHAAVEQAKERLTEIDATIGAFEANEASLDAAGKQQMHAAVEALRTLRETYSKEIDGVVAQGRQMTTDQLAVARTALAAPWTQFERDLDKDVAALKLDAAQRKALVEARLKAEVAYWRKVVADLESSAANLTAAQRAAIDARVVRVKARVEESQARLTRLSDAGRSAWSALKKSLIDSRKAFDETYGKAQ